MSSSIGSALEVSYFATYTLLNCPLNLWIWSVTHSGALLFLNVAFMGAKVIKTEVEYFVSRQ